MGENARCLILFLEATFKPELSLFSMFYTTIMLEIFFRFIV